MLYFCMHIVSWQTELPLVVRHSSGLRFLLLSIESQWFFFVSTKRWNARRTLTLISSLAGTNNKLNATACGSLIRSLHRSFKNVCWEWPNYCDSRGSILAEKDLHRFHKRMDRFLYQHHSLPGYLKVVNNWQEKFSFEELLEIPRLWSSNTVIARIRAQKFRVQQKVCHSWEEQRPLFRKPKDHVAWPNV